MSSFKGLGILCFYSNGLFQGHLIDKTTNDSPYSLAGKLSTHLDPNHNDCMEPDDFYKVLIQSHSTLQQQTPEPISLLLRRPKENDAGDLFSHQNEAEINDGYHFSFVTHHFLTGQEAIQLQQKYFTGNLPIQTDVTVCIGDIEFNKLDE
ncbi:hypothetical protein BD770DRAFT_446425 [Pilaira anomala]|nr:hypothetical protein BD770DRAFT_446425 [Pilaira anomala]